MQERQLGKSDISVAPLAFGGNVLAGRLMRKHPLYF